MSPEKRKLRLICILCQMKISLMQITPFIPGIIFPPSLQNDWQGATFRLTLRERKKKVWTFRNLKKCGYMSYMPRRKAAVCKSFTVQCSPWKLSVHWAAPQPTTSTSSWRFLPAHNTLEATTLAHFSGLLGYSDKAPVWTATFFRKIILQVGASHGPCHYR